MRAAAYQMKTMKTIKIVLLAAVCALPCTARATMIEFDGTAGPITGAAVFSSDIPEASAPERRAPAEWTIMVYMNAKNNLESSAIKDINEMEAVGSTDKVNILVEAGRIDGYDASNGDWKSTRRYRIARDADAAKIGSPVLADLGKTDMGDYRNIAAFGQWAKANYPAKRYMFIVWNHGSGWERKKSRGISYDEETGNHVNTPQLGSALREIGGVDLYASDACLMQMVEVAYELRGSAAFIAGSVETEPMDGFDYAALLSPLAAGPSMSPEQLGKILVDSFIAQYVSPSRGATYSLIKASELTGLAAATKKFTAAALRSGDKTPFLKARAAAQAYSRQENKDFYDLARLAAEGVSAPEVRTPALAVMEQLKRKVLIYSSFNNSDGSSWWMPTDFDDTNGLTVYLPAIAPAAGYSELQWADDSGWLDFAAWLARP
ncbi:MAG TPA: hypothetical protein DCW72_06675 [Elusimicrobia bacterium]|nr:hypothetical protein [Elusimicrobiota bacterium]